MWYPHTAAMADAGPRHTAAYDELLDKLREDPNLAGLDDQFFPPIPEVMPPTPEARGEFYIAALTIQLIHSVFRDLDLESQQDHPHSEGWMRIFRRWAAQPAVRDAWSVVRSTYGIRFRNFYDAELTPRR